MGSSALPIYDKFVAQAKKLNPRYLIMVIPSRWFSGGRGLDVFRNDMLHDDRIRVLHDFPDASDCFPGVEIKGGVCYFLWDRASHGACQIYSHKHGAPISESTRPLIEEGIETFIRFNEMISILKKVQAVSKSSFADIVSPNDPFGFDVRVEKSYKRVKPQYEMTSFRGSVEFYYNGWRKEGVGFVDKRSLRKGTDLVGRWKLFIPKAWGVGNPETDWLKPFAGTPHSCCTETYLVVGPFDDEAAMNNALSYTQTKFFHLMVGLIKITQNTMQKAYSLVPMQDFSKPWTDEELYAKYGLTEEEITFIESMIRPMDVTGGGSDE